MEEDFLLVCPDLTSDLTDGDGVWNDDEVLTGSLLSRRPTWCVKIIGIIVFCFYGNYFIRPLPITIIV